LRPLASPFDQGFRLYFSSTKGRLSEAKSAAATILALTLYQKWFLFYEVSRSLRTANVLAFLYVKVKSKVIYEEISFPSFFRKILISAFLLRLKANYLEKYCTRYAVYAWYKNLHTVSSEKYSYTIL